MLQTIHDKITGWVAYVILGAIALVFVLWGINWTLGAPTYAAKVKALSVGDLKDAARTLIDPDHLIWVIVGDRAKIEKSIRELNLGELKIIQAQ